jgi:predicted N-acetyltransferase YhbS
MIDGRLLTRDEIPLVWTIDRSEVIDTIYYFEAGRLQRRAEHYDVRGWPPGEAEKYTPILEACHDEGGWFHGLFDVGRLVGAAVLSAHFIARSGDPMQLKFLHVSSAYRRQGRGQGLFRLAQEEAARRGAGSLYISATPSQNTIDFYLRLGCTVTKEPDPELFDLEPEDIHLECALE